MKVTTLVLADAVAARDNYLSVLNGGLSSISHTSYPGPMSMDVGLVVSIDDVSLPTLTFTMRLRNLATSEIVTELRVEGVVELRPVQGTYVSACLALNAREVAIPAAGDYSLEIELSDGQVSSVEFSAVETPPTLSGD